MFLPSRKLYKSCHRPTIVFGTGTVSEHTVAKYCVVVGYCSENLTDAFGYEYRGILAAYTTGVFDHRGIIAVFPLL